MTLDTPAAEEMAGPSFNIITKALSGGTTEEGKRRFRATASSTVIDQDGDEITLAALEKMAQKFRTGLTIFMDHDFKHVDSAYGVTDSAEIVQRGIDDKGVAVWDLDIGGLVNVPNPRAVQLADSIDGGFVKLGTSITARVKKHERVSKTGGMKVHDLDVLEASIVGVPSNQRSWAHKAAVAIKSYGANVEEIMGDTEITETEDKIETINKAIDAEPVTPVEATETGDDAASTEPAAEEASGVQESETETPETAPTDEEHETDTPEEKVASYAPEDVAALVKQVGILVTEIGRLRVENAELKDQVTTEKQANQAVSTEVELAKEVIEKVMTTPLQPKTAAYVETFAKSHALFAPEVVDYLNKRSSLSER